MDTVTPVQCPNCHAPVAPADNFCEECGAKLSIPEGAGPPAPALTPAAGTGLCPNCEAGPDSIDAQGFCSQCGLQRQPPPRDHLEAAAGPGAAGISDRGLRHFRNEDAFALGQLDGYTAAVLCDGVSNSPRADEASAAAALFIRDALLAGIRAGAPDLAAVMETALTRAHASVGALAGRHVEADGAAGDVPATTALAVLARTAPASPGNVRDLAIGWLGDSRAYFVARNGGARLLTKDHSWINEVVDAGQMTRTEASRSKNAHTVTKTLGGSPGGDGRPDTPSTVRLTLAEPGWLILCSDGLWNYAPEAPELAAWVRRLSPSGDDALSLCRALTAEALRQGGRDNVTVIAVAV